MAVTVTDSAAREISSIIKQQGLDPEKVRLRVGVRGGDLGPSPSGKGVTLVFGCDGAVVRDLFEEERVGRATRFHGSSAF